MSITLDGSKIVMNKVSIVKKAEFVNQNNFGHIPIIQPTEIGDALRNLNNDDIDPDTRMSGIDMRSRIGSAEISPILAIDACVCLGVLPRKCLTLTRQKKRLSVSLNGLGRDDITNVVSGKQEMDAKKGGGSIVDRIKGVFSTGNKEGEK